MGHALWKSVPCARQAFSSLPARERRGAHLQMSQQLCGLKATMWLSWWPSLQWAACGVSWSLSPKWPACSGHLVSVLLCPAARAGGALSLDTDNASGLFQTIVGSKPMVAG